MEEKNKTLLVSCFLFILMLSLFFYYQEPGIFQHDMVEYAMYAEYVVLDDYDSLYGHYFSSVLQHNVFPWRTGTNYLTAALFYLLHFFGGSSEFATFFTQFVFGSLALVVLYLFLLELYGKQIPAIVGALVFSLSAPLFNAVLSKEQGTEFFFAFAAMYLLLRGMKKKKTIPFFFSSVCLGLLLWMREGSLFFPFIYYSFFFLQSLSFSEEKKQFLLDREICNLKNILAVALPYLVLAAAAWYLYVGLLFQVVVLEAGYTAPLFAFAQEILAELWQWFPFLYFIFVIAGLLFGILRKEKNVLFSIAISILFFIIFTRNSSFDIRQLGIFLFFPFSLMICYGLCCLLEDQKENQKSWKYAFVLFLAGILIVQVFIQGIPLFEQRKEHIYTKEFAEGIVSVVPEESVIFVQKDFCLFFLYYAKRHCEGLPVDFSDTVDGLLASGKRVFVLYEAGFGFYSDEAKAAIEEKYTLAAVYRSPFETFHHADLQPQIYNETLVEVKR